MLAGLDPADWISIHALREEGDSKSGEKSATFVPLYTLVHNLKRNFTKAPAK